MQYESSDVFIVWLIILMCKFATLHEIFVLPAALHLLCTRILKKKSLFFNFFEALHDHFEAQLF